MSIEKVRAYFRQYGMEDRVMEKEHSSATWKRRQKRSDASPQGSPRPCLSDAGACGAGGDCRRPEGGQ